MGRKRGKKNQAAIKDQTNKKKPQERRPKDHRFLRLTLSFCSLVIFLNIVVWYLSRNECLAFLEISISRILGYLIQLSGMPVQVTDNTMYLTNSVWLVTTECTALYIMVIYLSFVLVYPSSARAKGIAIGAGIPFIFSANVFRLYLMAWIDRLKPDFSGYFHQYAWQVVFIIMVVFMWIIWIDGIGGHETKNPVPR